MFYKGRDAWNHVGHDIVEIKFYVIEYDSGDALKGPRDLFLPMENMSGQQFFEYGSRLMKLHLPKATDFSQIARHLLLFPR